MSSMGLVLSIAKDALAAQQYGINVTAHNIANVNTPGYSRQTAVYETKEPAPYGGVLLGRGVDTTDVLRASDQFIENRLMRQKSTMFSSKEMENYMQVLEGLFNEDSEMSISTMLSDFWNSWYDIANNPSGAPERIALYEHSILLSEQFNNLDADLRQLETDLTGALNAGIDKINHITSEIAQLNDKIAGMETNSIANDLRDKRNTLTSELSEYLDVKPFEQSSGSLTVITAKGCVLVHGNDSYELEMGGDSGDRVLWGGSGGARVDITNYISSGKLGGWLDMRDEIIAKYKLDLDALAKEFIWAVNQQHSQEGVGLEAFTTVTGTYAVSDVGEELGTQDSGLDYYDEISDGTFNLWVYDSNGDLDGGKPSVIMVDADVTTLTLLETDIDAVTNISASITGGKVRIDADTGYTFAFSDDTSNVLASLGINTFFTGASAGGIGVNDKIGSDKNYITAAQVYNTVGPVVPDSDNTSTGIIASNGPYTGTADATYEIKITTDGTTFQWRKDAEPWSADTLIAGSPHALSDGVSVTFNAGTFVATDTFTISVTKSSGTYGDFASGDNTNALAITDLQYTSMDISQWTCDRINGDTEGSVTSTIENYYHSMVGSIGIKASSIERSNAFNEVMVEKLSGVRDSISAVSLDEEMTNLIKFQYAYQAAAKLISVSDELLNTLLSVK